jgi:glucose dehydrogenase
MNIVRLLSLSLPAAVLGVLTVSSVSAESWPGYRGPNGTGVSTETLAVKEFPKSGPKKLWTSKTPLGFSSFAVAGDKAITLVAKDIDGNPMEVCVALDANTGATVWEAPLWLSDYKNGGGNAGESDNKGGDGPRSTPTIDGDRVFVFDAHLRLYSLSLADGSVQWKVDLERDYNAENIRWLSAASPVISGDRLFVAGGGRNQSLLCFSKIDGKLLWKSESDAITHSTPVVTEILGVSQVIYFTQEGLVAVTPDKGDVLWRYDYKFNVSTAASPVVWEDIVYCSAGYDVGAGAVKISKTADGKGLEAKEIYRKDGNDLANHWSTPVVKDGYLYGMFSFKQYGKGPMACVDIRTGDVKWKEEGFGPGNVLLTADGDIVALTDRGVLVLAEASSQGYEELARADVIDGKCWSSPALADGKVYVRSTVEGTCVDLSGGGAE